MTQGNDWIDVKERLPEVRIKSPDRSINVLITDGEDYEVDYYWFLLEAWTNDMKATHWQPLPPPPNKK